METFHRLFCWLSEPGPIHQSVLVLSRWGHLAGVGIWMGLALHLALESAKAKPRRPDWRGILAYRLSAGLGLVFGLNLLHMRYSFPFRFDALGIAGWWTVSAAALGSAVLFIAALPLGGRLTKAASGDSKSMRQAFRVNSLLLLLTGPIMAGMATGARGGLGWGWSELAAGYGLALAIWGLFLRALLGRVSARTTAFSLAAIAVAALALAWATWARRPWSAQGERGGDHFGSWVASLGDVNGDGYADAAVWSAGHGDYAGKLYLYLGSASGLARKPAWTGSGQGPGHQYGRSFSAAGDVNSDGYGDFVVGASNYGEPSRPNLGKAYLYLGSPQGPAAEASWSKAGAAPRSLFGDGISGAGDINGDGLDDVVIGAYGINKGEGRAYLFFGSRYKALQNDPAWEGRGAAPNDWYGYSVGSAGDVNGDAYGDLLIGAKQAGREGEINVGRAYVYLGSAQGPSRKPVWTATGEAQNDRFAWWVASTACLLRGVRTPGEPCRCLSTSSGADLNGDGLDDLVLGSNLHIADDGTARGKVYVYYGTASGAASAPSWTYLGERPGAGIGNVNALGDYNGDGIADLALGGAGSIHLFYGGRNGLRASPDWSAPLPGQMIANAGDVNGDGFDDLLLGLFQGRGDGPRKGSARLLYGRARRGLSEWAW